MTFLTPSWKVPTSIHACVTTKPTWGALHDKAQPEASSASLMTACQLPASPYWINQTHSTKLVKVGSAQYPEADASYTDQPNQVCLVLTADCLPILICNRQGSLVCAIHAGWRGLAHGIIKNTIQALPALPEDLIVWLGPAIGPSCYEVGREVYDAFTTQSTQAHTAFLAHGQDKWLADLYGLARQQLHALGVNNIEGGQHCTFTETDLFFSYRREKEKAGRMASLIWIA